MRRFQVAGIQGLIALVFCITAASDIRAQEVAPRANAHLDKGDAKAGPNLHVRMRRPASEPEKPFSYSYKEWRALKLPWEPNAPGG